jgi:Icc-related predicted phosphoesterase
MSSSGDIERDKWEPCVRIAALGDLHVRESLRGAFREIFSDISQKSDVLLICGDLTDRGVPVEAEILADDLVHCKIPVLAVLGNHDFESGLEEDMKNILSTKGKITFLEREPVEIQGYGFAGAKGFCGGFDSHMLQPWGEEPIKRFVHEAVGEALKLETALAKLRVAQKFVVLHYAPIRQTVAGEQPEILPFLGSSRLLEPIERFGVSAVFHGHAHSGHAQGKTNSGIPVYNVSLPLLRRLNPTQPYLLLNL